MKDKSKPAFPVPDDASDMPGMSLRDYFAAVAVQGLLASNWGAQMRELAPELGVRQTANDAYDIADAMLKARAE